MRLGCEKIAITINGKQSTLRPTLRAAMQLEQRFGGFPNLFIQIAEGNLETIAWVIGEGSDGQIDAFTAMSALGSGPLAKTVEIIIEPLLTFVGMLAGIDDEALYKTASSQAAANEIPFGEYHRKLFGIATGVLGWAPGHAWTATPAEILEGYRARQEFVSDILVAVFGNRETEIGSDRLKPVQEKERASGIAYLKKLQAIGANRKRA